MKKGIDVLYSVVLYLSYRSDKRFESNLKKIHDMKTTTTQKALTINNHGAAIPSADVIVSEEFYNKVQQIEALLEVFERMSPALSASLRNHYRNGVADWNVDERLAFLSTFKLGLVSDIMEGM